MVNLKSPSNGEAFYAILEDAVKKVVLPAVLANRPLVAGDYAEAERIVSQTLASKATLFQSDIAECQAANTRRQHAINGFWPSPLLSDLLLGNTQLL